MFIYSYNFASGSAKNLSQHLGLKRIRHQNSRFRGRSTKAVVNWGCSELPTEIMKCHVINDPFAVRRCSNKLNFFRMMQDRGFEHVVPHTENRDVVTNWLEDNKTVVARTKLTGNSGDGIVLITDEEEIINAPLYTLYVPKKQEYRIHIFGGDVRDVQRKARRQDVADEDVDWKIRNHSNGFIFARNEGHQCPDKVLDASLACIEILGLDFGAVDTIYNEKQDKAYVLEVNTAPGLEGTTLDTYKHGIERMLR